ncbi:MAG: leucine-rich repeat protein, partial [Bacteroidales bacterium]|nr:leucine-rich repeat protein [Bacteroidales bacterium]
YAFNGCSGLTGSLTIGNSVTSIGDYAFNGCSGLTGSLTIGNSVTSIGNYAFYNCTGLTHVTIGNSVTSIGYGAFQSCTGLTTINYNAVNCSGHGFSSTHWLASCNALSTLIIGPAVESIPLCAFYNCSRLTGTLTIPNTVTSIGDYAFYNCSGLNGTLTIPNSVISIGQHAFASCTGLTGELTLGSSVTSIERDAFRYCRGLTSVTIPNSVDNIGIEVFYGCTGLTTMNYNALNCNGNGFTSYYTSWIEGCTNLTTLNIGPAVESIPQYAFYNRSSLTGTLAIPASVNTIGRFAFHNCSGLTQINYNAANASGGGFRSDSLWLSGCTGLTTLNIGSSVETIPNFAFYNLSRLTGSLTIPNSVTSIGNSAFSGCTGLTSVTIPNSVYSIGDQAFNSCTNLIGTLTIPNSVTNIGVLAFGNCTGLTTLNYNAVNCSGNGFTSGNNWLNGCTGLTTLNIGNEVTSIPNYAFYSRSSLIGTLAIPNSVTSIGNYAFYGCTGLTGSLTIPNSVTSIGSYSFYNCTGFTGQLSLPSSISSIGNYTFAGCYNLNSVSIPESVTTIGDYSFNNCSGLTGWLTIPNSVTAIGQYGLAGCSGLDKIVVGESVASIGSYAFSGCTEVDTLCFLSDNPATLAEYALYNYTGIYGIYNSQTQLNCVVTIPCNSLPTYQYAWGNQYNYFDECLTQYTVTVSTNNASWGSVSGAGTYYYNEEVVLTATPANGYYLTRWIDGNTDNPRTFRVTRDTAFTAIFGVERATTVDSLIYSNAGLTKVIGYVPGLTHAVIPNSVRTIADSAFLNCTTLRRVTIPESVTSIGKQAFYGCTGLTGILIIPSLVDTIGRYAFANCNFDTIRFLSSTPAGLAANALCNLNNTRLTCVLAIPCGTLSAYMSVWGSGYNYYDECSPQYTVTVVSNNSAWGSVSGGGTYAGGAIATLTATANTGYHFGQWNDGNTQNPRTVTVTADVSYTAQFVANQYTVTVYANDPTMGTVTGGGTYVQGATVTLTATPNTGYHFVQWSDGNTQNPRTVTVTGNATYFAQFVADQSPNQYTITVYANDPTMGTVTGGGAYVQGATATLTATANTGYHFVQWNDGNTQNPRIVTVTADATYVAYFAPVTGINDISSVSVTITVCNGRILVSGAEGRLLMLTDALGRILYRGKATEPLTVEAPATGIYLLQVDGHPARRISVVR